MRRIVLVCTFIIIIVAAAAPTPAQSQREMHEEASDDARAADGELAAVRAELAQFLDDDGRRELDAADRAFAAYRDAEVELAAGRWRGGSIAPMIACLARADVTRERARRLAAMLEEARDR